jgi:uncharacterized protein (TIGR03437 family)
VKSNSVTVLSNVGSGNTSTANLTVVSPPVFSKFFGAVSASPMARTPKPSARPRGDEGPYTIPLNGMAQLTFLVVNNNSTGLSGLAFSDTFPTGVAVAASGIISDGCGGSTVATPGTGFVSLSGGTVAANSNCSITLDVVGTTAGTKNNVTGAIGSTEGGAGGTASATLYVAAPPTIAKVFGAASIPLNGSTSLTFTLTNPAANTVPLAGVAFTDTLPLDMVVSSSTGLTTNCSGTATATPGSGSVSLSAATLPTGASCTLSVNITGVSAAVVANMVTVDSTTGGNGNTASATLAVVGPPGLLKTFGEVSGPLARVRKRLARPHGDEGPYSIPLYGTAQLSFLVGNQNISNPLTGVAFTDTLPSGVVVASPNEIYYSCAGTLAATPGSGAVSLSGGTIPANTPCYLSLNVVGTSAGTKNNLTSAIASNNGGTGAAATAILYVVAPPLIAKAFGAPSIPLNVGVTTLTFTLTSAAANTQALTGVAFTDAFPKGLQVAESPGLVNTCGGEPAAGDDGVSLSGGSIAAGSSCKLTVNVTGYAAGALTNTTSSVSSANGGSGKPATAKLAVAAPPTIAQAFGAPSIPLNTATSLTFTIANPGANTVPLAGVAFTDALPAGLVVSTPNNGLTNSCGGTPTATPGGTSVSLSAATLATTATCTLSVSVSGISPGLQPNGVTVTSTTGSTGNTSNANLLVVAPPVFSKFFGSEKDGPAARTRKRSAKPRGDEGPVSIPLNTTTQLTFNVYNPNTLSNFSGLAFSDTLPTGVVVASQSDLYNGCNGSIVATPGTNIVSLSGGTLTENNNCFIILNVEGVTAGTKNNVTGTIASNEGGPGLPASATLYVVAPPSIATAFGAPIIPLNSVTTLTFTLTNPAANTVAELGVAFTDTLPANLQVAATPDLSDTCGGTASAVAGSATVSLTGGSIAVGSACTFTVNVTGTASGAYTNTTGAVSSTNGGTGNAASANLEVALPPAIAETFGSATVAMNHAASLTFVLTNPAANTIPLAGVAFTDNLPAGLAVASPSGLTSTCGGTPTAAPGTGSVSLLNGVLAPQTSCKLSLNVTGVAAGPQTNSVTVTSTTGGTGNTAQAGIYVVAPPQIEKAYGNQEVRARTQKPSVAPRIPSLQSIPLNGSTTLSFFLYNPNSASPLTGVAFTDPLPAGLAVSSPNGLTGSCGAGTITTAAGSVTLSGATLGASASCSFSVNVTGTAAGPTNNVTSAVTSNEGGTGLAASASLDVIAPTSLAVSLGASGIPLNGVTSLTFTLVNPPINTVPLTGLGFTDNFPPDMFVASPDGLTNTCGGTPAAAAGGSSVSLSGATLPAGATCALTVNITVTAPLVFTTGVITTSSANGGIGTAPSVLLYVLVPTTFNTVPAGVGVTVDGIAYTGGQTLQLTADTAHTVSVLQIQPGTPGTQYVFDNWSDKGAPSHTISVFTPATYTASFTTQYQLTLAVTPPGSGTVKPASGAFYNAGTSVALTATANAGYVFNTWTAGANPPASATATVAMSGPENIVAAFQTAGSTPPQTIGGVVNGASFQTAQAAPNTILSLFGSNLSCTPAPQVLVNGAAAQVLYASNTQINFVVPTGLSGTGNTVLQVVCNGVSSLPFPLALSMVDPAIFTTTETGAGQGAILNGNYSPNGPQVQTGLGTYIMVYATGFGDLNPAGSDGLRHLALPVTATIGGVAAQVVYAGEAPGYTFGLQQINVLIPLDAPTGTAVPIQLTVDNVTTPSGVTIAIQ